MTSPTLLTTIALLLAASGLPGHAAGVPVSTKPAVIAGTASCQPAWPESSLEKKESGTVEMLLLVRADGRVSDARIVRSSGIPDLDKTALSTVAKCSFVAAQQDSEAIESWFPFKLEWKAARGIVPALVDFNTCAKPEWPKEALRNGNEGRVTLAFLIDTDGS